MRKIFNPYCVHSRLQQLVALKMHAIFKMYELIDNLVTSLSTVLNASGPASKKRVAFRLIQLVEIQTAVLSVHWDPTR